MQYAHPLDEHQLEVSWIADAHQNLNLNQPQTSTNSNQNTPPTPTPETLHLLRRKLTETRKLQSILLAERARNAAYIANLQALLTSTDPSKPGLAFITQSMAKHGLQANGSATALREQTRHAVSQLPQLRQLLAALRQKEDEGIKYNRHSVASEERREYIESQVRRRLEREGADLKTGEGLTGRSTEGRTVTGEEVRGIEGVVGLVGRERPPRGDRMEE